MNRDPSALVASEPAVAVSKPINNAPVITAMTVIRLAIWIGLIAGVLDLGLLVINKRWIDRDFYRLSTDFVWIIPAGVTLLVLVPGLLLAALTWIRGGRMPLSLTAGVLAFVGFLDVSARLPLELWASLLISAGLATQFVRIVRRRQTAFLRLVTHSVPVLLAMEVAVASLMLGSRAWSESRQRSALPAAPTSARNVLLIVWDTVRAGNLSLYGYERPTTPNLARFAEQGTRFDTAFATASWTLPSHASLFTGRWPHELGVGWNTPMKDDVPTLAEALAAHGYDTAGFVANLDYCGRETGLSRGFAHYEDYPIGIGDTINRYTALGRRLDLPSWAFVIDTLLLRYTGHWYDVMPRSKEHDKPAEAVNQAFLRWLDRRPRKSRPFFAFLNFNDAHSPYEVPEPSVPGYGVRPASPLDRQTLVQWIAVDKSRLSPNDVHMVNDMYDDSISYLDRQLGLLLNELTRRGVLEETLVIVTSDHGEHLGDHLLFFHGASLYRQVVQVPLVMVAPKLVPAQRTVVEPVTLADLPATVMDLLGFGADSAFPGRSLARCWTPPGPGVPPVREALLMETTKPLVLANEGREPAAKGPMKSLIAGGMHYIRSADGLEELFMLNSDSDEVANLAATPTALPVLEQFRNVLGLMGKSRLQARGK